MTIDHAADWAAMERLYAERGMGQRLGFGSRPAVLVIDLMRAFTDPDHPVGANLDAAVAQTRRLLDAARDARVPVIYTLVFYDEADMGDSGLWGQKASGVLTLRAGTADVQLDERLGALEGEAVIVKKYASAFFGTDLISRLNTRKVDTMIVCGATTSGCVRASVVDGLQYGLRMAVVREAVGDRAVAAHRQSLFDMDSKYADVVGVDETLTYLAAIAASATPAGLR